MVEDSSERIVIDVISLISRSVDVMIVMNVMFSNLMKIDGKYIIFFCLNGQKNALNNFKI